ncbi:MAG: ribosomal RNA small subunit methyltransferase A [Synergistaceae bacterium]|nr:ribosomal RNA small subunit methyltransferase A [Synergistaceae bacterium]
MARTMRALKRYGQNFLVDRNILGCIIRRAELSPDDVILEIGAGHGVLTRAILQEGVKHVHSVEIDERLRPELEALENEYSALNVHWGDAVRFDYDELRPFPNKVVANIPYNITTPLISELLKFSVKGLRYHLYMLQKEAAARIAARPDTKERYPLGVTIEAMGRVVIVRQVPRECFRPVPNVNSVLAEISLDRNFKIACDDLWSKILHEGFRHRRKTLANNLKGIADVLNYGGKRAEDLTLNQWLEIYGAAREKENPPVHQGA